MNAKELETQHNLKKWAAIIKECRSSGMKILQWLEINNISKDQYYYWQRKLKETCIDTLERQAATFVELPVTKEAPASTELTVTHTVCENKNDGCSLKNNTIAAVIKTNGVTFEITNTATPDLIKNFIEAFMNIPHPAYHLSAKRYRLTAYEYHAIIIYVYPHIDTACS